MTAHLMTRGTARKLDYRFIGDSPPQRWWSPLDDVVSLNRPTVVVHGGPHRSGALVSGIPSARRDVIGTPIRFTLVVEDAGPALVARLVNAGLDAQARAELGAELDAVFSSELVDGALRGEAGEVAELATHLERVLTTDEQEDEQFTFDDAFNPRGKAWVGSVDAADAVAEFRHWTKHLGRGTPGWAFTTSGLSSVDGARKAVATLGEPAAVLLDDGGPREIVRFDVERTVDEGVGPGKAQAGPGAGRTPMPPGRKVLIGALALIVVAVATIMLIASGPAPAPPPQATPTPAAPTSPSTSSSPTAVGGAGRAVSG